jgi:hypothetical protein
MAGNFISLQGAADFIGPGAIETPKYEAEILDMTRRRGVLGQRIKSEPANGHPHRYFEQTRIIRGAFADPRNMSYSPGNDPTRRERGVMLKALYSPVLFGLFDVEVARQQGNYNQLLAKDITDSVEGVLYTSDLGLWNGTDTDLMLPSTLEYVGGLTQINRTFTVASTASIVDSVKAEIAALMADRNFRVLPTAVYANPTLCDLIDQEERLNQRQMPQAPLNVTGGLVVNHLATQAGLLPVIPDWSLFNGAAGQSSTESGKTDYKLVILSESMVVFYYLTSAIPRVFALGLEGDLNTRYSIVYFGAPVFKGKADFNTNQSQTEGSQLSYSHSVGTIVR